MKNKILFSEVTHSLRYIEKLMDVGSIALSFFFVGKLIRIISLSGQILYIGSDLI